MTTDTKKFDDAFMELATDVVSTLAMDHAMAGKGPLKLSKTRSKSRKTAVNRLATNDLSTIRPRNPVEIAETVLSVCRRKRKVMSDMSGANITDDELCTMARFTDKFKLQPYQNFMHYVPRLVNVVTLAEAIPTPESGLTLPLDLHHIAARCRNSYYAPKKFSAVQLAYSEPRCRVLVFRKF